MGECEYSLTDALDHSAEKRLLFSIWILPRIKVFQCQIKFKLICRLTIRQYDYYNIYEKGVVFWIRKVFLNSQIQQQLLCRLSINSILWFFRKNPAAAQLKRLFLLSYSRYLVELACLFLFYLSSRLRRKLMFEFMNCLRRLTWLV